MCAYDTRWQLRCIACTRPAAATGSPEGLLQGFQFGKRQHQPFAALAGKVHLHPGLGTGTFKVEHHAFAKYRMAYRLTQGEGCIRYTAAMEQAAAGTMATGTALLHAHRLHQLGGNLGNKTRLRVI